jgi:hypothetical protein
LEPPVHRGYNVEEHSPVANNLNSDLFQQAVFRQRQHPHGLTVIFEDKLAVLDF